MSGSSQQERDLVYIFGRHVSPATCVTRDADSRPVSAWRPPVKIALHEASNKNRDELNYDDDLSTRAPDCRSCGLGALLIVGTLVYHAPRACDARRSASRRRWRGRLRRSSRRRKRRPSRRRRCRSRRVERQDYIVQAKSIDLARRAVEKAGGRVTGELDIIRAVGASLDAQRARGAVRADRRRLARL